MERLKYWLLPVYVVVGFLALLLALPQSRWIVLTQVEAFSGAWRKGAGDTGIMMDPNFVRPVQRGLEYDNLATDPTAVFLQLLTPRFADSNADAYQTRMAALFQRCKENGTPEYWAAFARVASVNAIVRKDEKPLEARYAEQRRKMNELLVQACEAGTHKDPDNAYFPLIASGAYYGLGDLNASHRAFLAASGMSDYRDYVRLEPEMRYKYLVDHYGYRGNRLRAWVFMETMLQHLSEIRTVAVHYAQTGNAEDRVATARIAGLMIYRDESLIGLLVGRFLFLSALNPTFSYSEMSKDAATKDMVARAASLDALTKRNDDLASIAKDVERLNTFPQVDWPNGDRVAVVFNMLPAWSGWSLLTLLVLPGALFIARLKAKSERFAAISPCLVWVGAFFAEPILGMGGEVGQYFGFASLLFMPALFPKLRRYADWLGIILALFAFGLVVPPLLFVISLIVERRKLQVSTWAASIATVVVCMVAAGVWTYLGTTTGGGNGLIFGGVFALASMCGLPALSKVKLPMTAGLACIALGGVYAAMVYRDLAADRQLGVVCDLMLNEAKQVREGRLGIRELP